MRVTDVAGRPGPPPVRTGAVGWHPAVPWQPPHQPQNRCQRVSNSNDRRANTIQYAATGRRFQLPGVYLKCGTDQGD